MIICTFAIGDGEIYAMNAAELIEIVMNPENISHSGMIAIRSEFMAVINPTKYIDVEYIASNDMPLVLVCAWQGQGQRYAVEITEVFDVVSIDDALIQPDPIRRSELTLIDGAIVIDHKLIVLLNIQSLVQMNVGNTELNEDGVELF